MVLTESWLSGVRSSASECASKGDVVLIKDSLPSGNWRLGKITELIKSADGQTKIQTESGNTLNRPLKLLVLLETSGVLDEPTREKLRSDKQLCQKAKRKATVDACKKIQKCLNQQE